MKGCVKDSRAPGAHGVAAGGCTAGGAGCKFITSGALRLEVAKSRQGMGL